jgi:hypothetical protein
MKVDFRKVEIKDIEGKKVPHDLSKDLGNAIFKQTTDLGELDLARDIYHKGEVDLNKKDAEIIKHYVEEYFLAFIKETLIPVLDLIINEKGKPSKNK